MISIEVVKDRAILLERLAVYKNVGSGRIIYADYESIVLKLLDNGRKKWYLVRYWGKKKDFQEEFSVLKLNMDKTFFVDISMANQNLAGYMNIVDMLTDAMAVYETDNVEVTMTIEDNLKEDDLELFLVIPEYEIGWRLYRTLENPDK